MITLLLIQRSTRDLGRDHVLAHALTLARISAAVELIRQIWSETINVGGRELPSILYDDQLEDDVYSGYAHIDALRQRLYVHRTEEVMAYVTSQLNPPPAVGWENSLEVIGRQIGIDMDSRFQELWTYWQTETETDGRPAGR